jgi:hypothetical protein
MIAGSDVSAQMQRFGFLRQIVEESDGLVGMEKPKHHQVLLVVMLCLVRYRYLSRVEGLDLRSTLVSTQEYKADKVSDGEKVNKERGVYAAETLGLVTRGQREVVLQLM